MATSTEITAQDQARVAALKAAGHTIATYGWQKTQNSKGQAQYMVYLHTFHRNDTRKVDLMPVGLRALFRTPEDAKAHAQMLRATRAA